MWVYLYIYIYMWVVEKCYICGLKVGVCIICECALHVGIYGTSRLNSVLLLSSSIR